jgi:hypothetical protein
MFGDVRTTLTSLRRTCLDLVARERALRAEATPEVLARLDLGKSRDFGPARPSERRTSAGELVRRRDGNRRAA